MIITPDNQYLITASKDGSMFQMKISELTQGINQDQGEQTQKKSGQDKDQNHILPYSELFLER